jgi:hypothetical protein
MMLEGMLERVGLRRRMVEGYSSPSSLEGCSKGLL